MNKYFELPKASLIYVFRINDALHEGCLKIGETTFDDSGVDAFALAPNNSILNRAARKRIDEYTRTAAVPYELLYTETALYRRGLVFGSFNDKEVHQVLQRSGVNRKKFKNLNTHGIEWFETDLGTVKRAIKALKDGRESLAANEVTQQQSPIVFRPEQRAAIEMTLKRFKVSSKVLWDAKMRFGKTLSALQVIKERQCKRTLILTHRPVVDQAWFEDFHKIFYDSPEYRYGSKGKGDSFANLERHSAQGDCYVYFASMQDLRGSGSVGGKFEKNDELFSTNWDLVIVDEAHEGTQTKRGQAVLAELIKKNTKVLELSGTAYNLYDDYREEDIYTWDYIMEQKAKAQWDLLHFGDPNPYACLPKLNIFTYNLGEALTEFADEDVAFNFREFFRVDARGLFVHESAVRSFLDLLVKPDSHNQYPFSTDEFRSIFRHTLWVLPGVKAAKALSKMLQTHSVFSRFQVVNVAGDGDDDAEGGEALERVNEAIGDNPDETWTITLSCGRLTTGVSVPAWMGVFMLSGSYNTSAKAYMQTIFRVQTPATINGRMKENCYVFDFAPDRTLQVLATVPKISVKPGKTDESRKRALGEFLNFCPVIACSGSRMVQMNETRMLQQLKKAYVERVVRNGFEDASLYNDGLMKLQDGDLKDFENLQRIIGTTKAMPKTDKIDINNQGLTNEEYEEKEKLEKKPKKERSEAELKRLAELKEKAKKKQNAISILRGISIRMPLLIYGAEIVNEEQELTIDNFTSLVDPLSWEEFMPRGVTKHEFNKFKRFYDAEIFSAAAKRIRAMARAADKLSIEDRISRIASIFATFRNPDKETVLTPWRVVNMHMSETLGGFSFFNEDFSAELEEPRLVEREGVTACVFAQASRLLEINSKSGLYPLYLTYNIYRRRVKEALIPPETLAEHQELWDKTVRENIFVICKTPMAKSITRRTLMGFRPGRVNARYFEDLINQIKNKSANFVAKVVKGHAYWKSNFDDNMKFNAVVGNPPYQEEGISTRKSPVYHLFYDIAFKLADKVSLITPARFLARAGQTPKEWMDKMLNDEHFMVAKFFQKSADVFPTVDIKGGVVMTYRDAKCNFGKIAFFSEFEELRSVLQKVRNDVNFVTGEFASLISSQGLYKFSNILFDEHPRVYDVQGSGTASKITSKSLSLLNEVFVMDKTESDGYIEMLGLIKNKRVYRWINKEYVVDTPYLMTYNVLVPEANGSGAIGEVLSTPLIGQPLIGHTDTFLSIGQFTNETEAENCRKYICTKFARTMLGTLKVTQHNPRDSWANVPMQDFTHNSDIDWDKSTTEIDAQLYHKYKLDDKEIAFIEAKVRAMS